MRYRLTTQEYMPFTLAEHSTHAPDPTKHILRSHDVEMSLKKWDEDRLADWRNKFARTAEEWVDATIRETYPPSAKESAMHLQLDSCTVVSNH